MVLVVTLTPHGPWTHVGVCWVHACLTTPLEGHTTTPEQSKKHLRNSPRTSTVFERSDTAEVAYMIYYSLERTCYIVLEVTMTRHGPWRYVGKCWVHACPLTLLETLNPRTALYC
jgi:hypothetical protein